MTSSVTKPANGVTVTVSPSSFTLGPGQTQTVTFHAQAGNLSIPTGYVFDGEITFTGGGSTLRVPWVLVRAARLTMTYDTFGTLPTAIAPDKTVTSFNAWADNAVETYVLPGKKWDIFFPDTTPSPVPCTASRASCWSGAFRSQATARWRCRMTTRRMPYHSTAAMRTAQCSGRLPATDPLSRHVVLLLFEKTATAPLYMYIGRRELFYMSTMPNYTITPFEEFYDAEHMRFYDVQHTPIDGATVQGPLALEKGVADYHHAKSRGAARMPMRR